MAVNRLFNIRPQYVDSNGDPANGYRLFFYAAGSSTKQSTYNDSSGGVANTNPIVLNSSGQPATEVWGTIGQSYKIGFAAPGADDPPSSFIWTEDNVATPDPASGASATISEWQTYSGTPTFLSSTTFSLTGDQRATFNVGRRLRLQVTAGTIYAYVRAVAFTSSTTVTVVNDSTALDSGLSAVAYGILSGTNASVPVLTDTAPTARIMDASDTTKVVTSELAGLSSSTPIQQVYSGETFNIGADYYTPGLTIDATRLTSPGRLRLQLRFRGSSLSSTLKLALKFRDPAAASGQYETIELTSSPEMIVGDGSTLGTVDGIPARIYVLAIKDGSTCRLGVYNPVDFNASSTTQRSCRPKYKALSESLFYSGVSASSASTADSAHTIYTSATVTSKAIRILGYFEVNETTAGTWANGFVKFHPMTPETPKMGSIVQMSSSIQHVKTATATTYTSGTGPMTSSDGASIMSATITPVSDCNLMQAEWFGWCDSNSNARLITGLFVGAETDARAATTCKMAASDDEATFFGRAIMPTGTAASTTYTIRGAGNTGTSQFFGQQNGGTPQEQLGASTDYVQKGGLYLTEIHV